VQQNWCRCGSVETTLESGGFEYHVACDAKGCETPVEKLRLAMKSASAKSVACERPKPSSSSDVSFERRRREAASRRAVEENQSSVTARSRCRGKAAAAPNERTNERTNDVIILSSSSSSPSSIVKFHVTANEQI
jgi:hypothetical protein